MSGETLTELRVADVLAEVAEAGPEDPVTFGTAEDDLLGLGGEIRRVIACHVEASIRLLVETTDPEWGMQVRFGADGALIISFPVGGSEPERRIDLRQVLRDEIADNAKYPGPEEDRQWDRERCQQLADLFEELAAIAREEASR